jgi:enoyl-CoA hydratase/carnithine racemase
MSRVEIDIKDHIAVVSFNRPEKMNALDLEQFNAIIDAAQQIEENPSVRVVILKGNGKAFCAGLDLMSMQADSEVMSSSLLTRTHGIANRWQQVVWCWRELSVPVIAAVHGVAFGGGLQIMLGADIKYITPDTKLSIMELKWGIIPDMAGTQLMRHSVRADIIKELSYTHRVFSGTKAVEYGFATHLSDEPYEAAYKLAQEITSKSPSAIVAAKKLLNDAPYLDPEKGLLLESDLQDKIMKKHNQIESVMANFQKREANYKDARKGDIS